MPRPLAVSDSVLSANLVVESPKRILSHLCLSANEVMSRRRVISIKSVLDVADDREQRISFNCFDVSDSETSAPVS